jgi:ceramide glucosyltransferase
MGFGEALIVWALTGLAVAGVGYTVLASLLVRGFFPSRPHARTSWPGVTLLKPLYLDEPGLEANLSSFFQQDYEGPIQIIFGVHGLSDPALRIARSLCKSFPEHDVKFIIDPSFTGLNPKIANLINMQRHARHQILIASDSDISVPADYVRTIVAELSRPNVGAVTCMYRGKPIKKIWSDLEAMYIDYSFLPNVVVGTVSRLARPCFGSTIALRQNVLHEIGGFEAISRHLADDYEIGRAVRSKGYDVRISSVAVDHSCSEVGLASLVHHELRWAKTVRVVNGPGHLGSVVTHAFPLALIAAAVQGFTLPALLVVASALAARFLLAWRIRRAMGSHVASLWLLPARDMLSFGIFLASFFGNSVYWRGTRYLTTANGVLAQQ